MLDLRKGMMVKAQWLESAPVSLAGVQPKMGAKLIVAEGIVVGIHGDHPTNPTTIKITLDTGEVIDSEWITEVKDSLTDTLLNSVLSELKYFEQSGESVITYYRNGSKLESIVKDAIAKVESYLSDNYPTMTDLHTYLKTCDNLELLQIWSDDLSSIIEKWKPTNNLELLNVYMQDDLPYIIACDILGYGNGLWALFFDNFPCLHTLVSKAGVQDGVSWTFNIPKKNI